VAGAMLGTVGGRKGLNQISRLGLQSIVTLNHGSQTRGGTMSEHDRPTRPHVDESGSKENYTEAKKKHDHIETNGSTSTKIVETPINPPSGNT
jgi:hypothetical protein